MNHLTSLFAQKRWANKELFNRLANITAEQHTETIHTATRTLNHIYVVDKIFQAHLQGEPHAYTATNTPETPTLAELEFAVAETDAWFERYAASASAEQLGEQIRFRFTDGDSGTMRREEMLLHIVTHGAYP